tara:strand:+ start:1094 stop:1762 length:669 start_codon:yes stop_codon:yes gene_type:complete
MQNKYTLSETEIEQLFIFVKKKFVNYYDLQVELVDHLASLIEADMEENPNHNFETALNKVYAGFGIFGFWTLVKERTNAAYRNGRKLWWQHFKALFGWPAASVSMVIAVGLYFGLEFLGYQTVTWTFAAVVVITSFTLVLQTASKKRMFASIVFSQGALGGSVSLAFQIPLHLAIWSNNEFLANSTWTFPIYLLVALSYLAMVKVHQQVLNELKHNYPLAFQ